MKKGFISIPIIIAIIIGTSVVGGASYFGIQQYQKSVAKQEAITKTGLESEREDEIQKLREELELLKDQQSVSDKKIKKNPSHKLLKK